MEFIAVARELEIFTIKKCVKFPKRYTFYLSKPISDIAFRIHSYVKLANGIYPTNQHEVQMRRDYFLKAHAELYNLVSQIEISHEIFGLDFDTMKNWMEIVDKEIGLIKGTLKKDRERYKNIA